jgi:hypothetical protein
VIWQLELAEELGAQSPTSARLDLTGSVTEPTLLDGWSDLDVHLDLGGQPKPFDLLGGLPVWAVTEERSGDQQVLRTVLRDGRRLDLVAVDGLVAVPSAAVDNDVRFLAALAAAKLGRGDQLIGFHLTLELLRACLVQAMLLRDRDRGTNVHRRGSERDALSEEVAALAGSPLSVTPRPNIVEQAVALYARWRAELDPGYQADWSGLTAVLERGLGTRSA